MDAHTAFVFTIKRRKQIGKKEEEKKKKKNNKEIQNFLYTVTQVA